VAAAIAAGAEIRTDFDGGSTGKIEKISNAHFRVDAKGQTDQNGRNRQANWYYFRVDGAERSGMVFDMVNLPGEYNFKPNRGAITKDTPPVISYDRKTWTHVSDVEYDAAEPRLRLRVKPTATRFWIAHTPPYTSENLDRLRRAVGRSREQTIGKTVQGRDIYLWTIGSGDKTVWLMFRQHAWESGSSWVGEGVVRELLQDARGITWKVLPMCDPDGVALGGVRFNVNGYDLNRNWDAIDRRLMPEIAAQHKAVADWVAGGHKVDLFLSLHNTETAEYLEGPPDGSVKPLAERFFAALKDKTTFDPNRPLFYAAETTTKGMKGRMTVIQGLSHDFRIPAFLMEQRVAFNPKLGRLPRVEDRLEFGRQLVAAIAESLHLR
jgi:hypothetical protein